uniref:NADH dehydrogenase [ubiquinone] 1 alpha subcomplex subunit 9, mitochondrial n=1 Tax=Phlebotomus papatasi TaxID=29031 RepID=A0A1B0DP10_PHLPP
MSALVLCNSAQFARQNAGSLAVLCTKAQYSTDAPRALRTTNLAAMKRGTGGRSSFNGMVATVFGCTGFMGRYVCNKLGKIGTQMILPYRADHYDAIRLKVTGDLGQVLFQFYSLEDEEAIRKAVRHSNVVINLVGRDWETNNFNFTDVHVNGARRIAKVCREMGVERLIHVSALNASPNPEPLILKEGSKFLKSKYYGELAVREEFPEATIFRPSDIYGQEDRFLRYYAHVWRRQLRGMPLWHKGEKTIKQPVFCSDLAQGIVNAAKDPDTAGKVYQAIGNDYDMWGYIRYDMRWDPTFMLKVKLTEAICPSFKVGDLHSERVEREYVTDVVLPSIPTLEDLGVTLTKMEDQIPWELRPYRAAQYYDAELDEFEKPAPPKYIEASGRV